MQYVRIITKEHVEKKQTKGDLYYQTSVSINFKEQKAKVWNGAYWEEIPFEDLFVIATFDADDDYEDK